MSFQSSLTLPNSSPTKTKPFLTHWCARSSLSSSIGNTVALAGGTGFIGEIALAKVAMPQRQVGRDSIVTLAQRPQHPLPVTRIVEPLAEHQIKSGPVQIELAQLHLGKIG